MYLFQSSFVTSIQAAYLADDAMVRLSLSDLLSTHCHSDLAAWVSYIFRNKPDISAGAGDGLAVSSRRCAEAPEEVYLTSQSKVAVMKRLAHCKD